MNNHYIVINQELLPLCITICQMFKEPNRAIEKVLEDNKGYENLVRDNVGEVSSAIERKLDNIIKEKIGHNYAVSVNIDIEDKTPLSDVFVFENGEKVLTISISGDSDQVTIADDLSNSLGLEFAENEEDTNIPEGQLNIFNIEDDKDIEYGSEEVAVSDELEDAKDAEDAKDDELEESGEFEESVVSEDEAEEVTSPEEDTPEEEEEDTPEEDTLEEDTLEEDAPTSLDNVSKFKSLIQDCVSTDVFPAYDKDQSDEDGDYPEYVWFDKGVAVFIFDENTPQEVREQANKTSNLLSVLVVDADNDTPEYEEDTKKAIVYLLGEGDSAELESHSIDDESQEQLVEEVSDDSSEDVANPAESAKTLENNKKSKGFFSRIFG